METSLKQEDLLWTYEIKPELYKDRKYQIRNNSYGLYKKKDAEIICEFLRKNLAKIIYDIVYGNIIKNSH